MKLVESLIKSYLEVTAGEGMYSDGELKDKEGKLLPDPNVEIVNNINFSSVDGSAEKNKDEFDKEVMDKTGVKPAETDE